MQCIGHMHQSEKEKLTLVLLCFIHAYTLSWAIQNISSASDMALLNTTLFLCFHILHMTATHSPSKFHSLYGWVPMHGNVESFLKAYYSGHSRSLPICCTCSRLKRQLYNQRTNDLRFLLALHKGKNHNYSIKLLYV